MELFPRRKTNPVEKLHPSFAVREGMWRFNRRFDARRDEEATMKTRFGFDDPTQLSETEFLTKIGKNLDENIPHAFIGFSYARPVDREKLEAYARSYPWAELITNLNRDGESTSESQHIPLTHD